MKTTFTTYKKATDNISLILCNDIVKIDNSVYDNLNEDLIDEDENIEVYQYFLTDLTETEMKEKKRRYGLHFSYSEKLGLYVLCVTHFGTSWDYVTIEDKGMF